MLVTDKRSREYYNSFDELAEGATFVTPDLAGVFLKIPPVRRKTNNSTCNALELEYNTFYFVPEDKKVTEIKIELVLRD